jgi:AcrR family transcriptional regulator
MKPLTGPMKAATETQVKVPTRRAVAKQQTRRRVLAAARRLFSEQGYEGATIRDIAAAAGMSTGAVFANFNDKADLFREIMIADMGRLAEKMREAAAEGGGVEEVLVRIFGAGYAFYQDQLPLARAAFCVGWSPDEGMVLRTEPATQVLRDIVRNALVNGVKRGELIDDPQLELRARMLYDCYLSNYIAAVFGGSTLNALQDKARQQICILLASARRS